MGASHLLKLYRAPFIGLFAFVAALLANPVAHALGVSLKELMQPGMGGAGPHRSGFRRSGDADLWNTP